jgi:hypothetical protein
VILGCYGPIPKLPHERQSSVNTRPVPIWCVSGFLLSIVFAIRIVRTPNHVFAFIGLFDEHFLHGSPLHKVFYHSFHSLISSDYKIAEFYADLGDKEQAIQWLNTAYQEHDEGLEGLKTDFLLDPVRPDPRFAELVRRVGLPQ